MFLYFLEYIGKYNHVFLNKKFFRMTFLRRNLVLISFLSLIVQLDVYAEKINSLPAKALTNISKLDCGR